MPVITRDITVDSVGRDELFAWLREPEHHRRILDGAFASVQSVGQGVFELQLPLSGSLSHRLCYELERFDQEHGGRRVWVRTLGRRVKGTLRYSLTSLGGGAGTRVTLHLDYSPGRALGILVDRLMLRQALERASDAMLQNMADALASE